MDYNSQISWVLLGKIYCVLSMNMGMCMPKNHELFLPWHHKKGGNSKGKYSWFLTERIIHNLVLSCTTVVMLFKRLFRLFAGEVIT